MRTIKKQLKRFITWFYLRHSKLYTMLILILGILLGLLYEGRGDLGDDGHGGKCMIEKYRAKTYKELCNYLKEIGEEWRVEDND